jgi:glyoxylase-like metal-dependent hydrolase (beta-lactamase superfamily II)
MKLYNIETGNFKLDGGAMFGVVPKTIWNKTNPADAKNMIDISASSLLIEEGNRLILIDTGMGDKQSEKFFSYYYLWGDHSLEKSLNKHGFTCDDITDVFFTHLHFDHCGGAVKWNKDKTGYELTFKNARYWSNKNHWEWATNPNSREKASFLKENILPIQESGNLFFVDDTSNLPFEIIMVDGHTEKQMLPLIKYNEQKILFAADLIPTAGHLPIPYVMGFDTRPLITLKEKQLILKNAVEQNYLLFLEHDPYNEIINLKNTEKGIRINETLNCKDVF